MVDVRPPAALLLLVASLAGCHGPRTLDDIGPNSPAGSGMAYLEVRSRRPLLPGDGYRVTPIGFFASTSTGAPRRRSTTRTGGRSATGKRAACTRSRSTGTSPST